MEIGRKKLFPNQAKAELTEQEEYTEHNYAMNKEDYQHAKTSQQKSGLRKNTRCPCCAGQGVDDSGVATAQRISWRVQWPL